MPRAKAEKDHHIVRKQRFRVVHNQRRKIMVSLHFAKLHRIGSS